jgi:hypothetical protein
MHSPIAWPALAAVAALCLWGTLETYAFETTYQHQNRDPYMIAAQFDRLASVAALVPENAILGYLTDVQQGSVSESAMLIGHNTCPRRGWWCGEQGGSGCSATSPGRRISRHSAAAAGCNCSGISATAWCYFAGIRSGGSCRWGKWFCWAGFWRGGGSTCAFGTGVGLAATIGLELALLAWGVYEVFRWRAQWALSGGSAKTRTPMLLMLAALLGLGIATAAIAAAWDNNPEGNWDRWAIWNLRARFLASGPGLAACAWSPLLWPITHPSTPCGLGVGGSVVGVRAFACDGCAGGHFLYLPFGTTGNGGRGRGGAARADLGTAGSASAVARPALVHEVPAQYADEPWLVI